MTVYLKIKRILLLKTYLSTIIFIFLLSGCASKNLLENSAELHRSTEIQKTKAKIDHRNYKYEYVISPHDRIQIAVYNHPELGTEPQTKDTTSRGILIDSNGIVDLPLIGSIKLSGLTQTQAGKKLQRLYGKYLKKSNVHIEVLNKKAYIIGEVRSQGSIALEHDQISLLQAIATKGGFNDNANREKLIIIRKMKHHPKLEIVNLTDITSLSYTSLMIRSNDIIYVPSTNVKVAGISLYPLMALINATLGTYVKIRDIND